MPNYFFGKLAAKQVLPNFREYSYCIFGKVWINGFKQAKLPFFTQKVIGISQKDKGSLDHVQDC